MADVKIVASTGGAFYYKETKKVFQTLSALKYLSFFLLK
jgi:hypothetical protein